jgi:hypothetical protein
MLDYKKVTPTTTCQYNGDTMTTGLVTPSKENTETVASAAATGLFDLEMASLHPKVRPSKVEVGLSENRIIIFTDEKWP